MLAASLVSPQVAKEGHVRYAAEHAYNGRKKGRMLKPRPKAAGHLWVKWSTDGRQYDQSVHRLVFRTWVVRFPANESAVNGKPAERPVVDHIDGNKANNHASNLQILSHTANSRKRSGRNSNNTSRANGVPWEKSVGKCRAFISVDGKRRTLGFFVDKAEAKEARLAAAKKY